MSLFHDLLRIRSIYEAAMEGRGYFITFKDARDAFLGPQEAKPPKAPAEGGAGLKQGQGSSSDLLAPTLPKRWTVVENAVLDLALVGSLNGEEHPGGRAILQLAEGRDATVLFHSVHALASNAKIEQWRKRCTVGTVEDFPELLKLLAVSGPGEAGAFKWGADLSPFAKDLATRVRAHFAKLAAAQGITYREATKAPPWKWNMVVVMWSLFAAAFAGWLSGSWLGLLLLPIFGALATFHTFHDASHGSLSSRAWVNELLSFSGFLIAAPHEWRWQHIHGHHSFTNIASLDPDSKHANRWVSPEEQHMKPSLALVPVVWLLAVPLGLQGLATVRYLKACLSSRGSGSSPSVASPAPPPTPSLVSLAAVVLHRLVFFVLPFVRFGLWWGFVWAAYPAAAFSLLFMLNTQLAHLNEVTDGDGERKSDCWYEHQLATTVDLAPDSMVHWFLSGGLNLQVEHHLFPTVDHSHLPELRRVVADVCAEHSVQYHSLGGYCDGLVSHLRHLKDGHASPPPQSDSAGGEPVAAAGGEQASGGSGGALQGGQPAAGGAAAGQTSGAQSPSAPSAGAGPGVDGARGEAARTFGRLADGRRERVCVVGSGISGNGAAYFLRDSCHVTLCEREERQGGHAHTVEVAGGHRVDIGFQVFNYSNYPLLTKLFDELGVATVESNMSLSVAGRGLGKDADFEWSSAALFPTWGSLFDPRNWLRLFEILKFERCARQALQAKTLGELSLQQWLDSAGFSARLRNEYIGPMSAALWSCPTSRVFEFPAVIVLGFLDNHFMLQRARPKWRTPRGRSEEYVRLLHDALRKSRATIRGRTEVARFEQHPDGSIVVFDVQGRVVDPEPFDRIVLAVHADVAAGILRRSSLPADEQARAQAALGNFRYFPNEVCVHADPALMPKDPSCWGAWNVLQLPGTAAVTYWANKLQPGVAPAGKDLFITLNAPEGSISQDKVLSRYTLDHPVLDSAALAAQRALPSLQGLMGGRVYLCGAWAGYGFHEDGLRSARDACEAMGADVSAWPAGRRPLQPLSFLGSQLWKRALAPGLGKMIKRGSLRVVFGNGAESTFGDGTGPEVELRIASERALWRLLLDPGMGLADGYVEGELEVRPDILDLFRLVLGNKQQGDQAASPMAWSPMRLVTPLAKRYYASLHARRANSHEGSRKNIAAHYDLSNSMFEKFLSEDMTYSAGIFDEEVEALQKKGATAERDFLELAQRKKLDRMLDIIDLKAGDSVLEIGCGWGSMAIHAAKRCPGLKSWTAITISKQQLELARERIAAAGVSGVVQAIFCDYRDAAATFGAGTFTKVVSCEMIEAVGHEFLPGYFAAIDECLAPGGKASIQAICVPDARYESYLKGSDFIRERIFPGSSLVTLEEIERACRKGHTSLRYHGEPFSVGLDYAKTLHEWRVRFAAHEGAIRKEVSTFGEGFDDKFCRLWHYYFAYCEAGFETKHIDDWQVCLEKDAGAKDTGRTAAARGRTFDGDALHAGRAGFWPGLSQVLARPKRVLMQVAVGMSQRLLDKGLLPDWLTRFGIRMKLAQKIKEETHGCVELDQAVKLAFIEQLKGMPIAICTAEANEQHYEVPPELYHLWLGPRKKYSGCIFPEGAGSHLKPKAAELLPAAEEAALEQYVERAELKDGMAILDLGCGWGSASLFLAERLPKALIVGVSNSHGQRGWIMAEAQRRGLDNVRIVTCDVSKVKLAEVALPALRAERPDAAGFDRCVSVEMMEHMKNYDILLERVSDALRPGGKLFVHIFVHTRFAYHFVAKTEADWMARYFFAGGTMPSADLLFYFQRSLKLLRHWHVNGRHYQLTAEGWLQNTDKHAKRIKELLRQTYPPGTEEMWFNRWRAFFMACAELWGYNNGNEWIVAHYLFEKPAGGTEGGL